MPGRTVGAKVILKNGEEVLLGKSGLDTKASTALLTRKVNSIKLSLAK